MLQLYQHRDCLGSEKIERNWCEKIDRSLAQNCYCSIPDRKYYSYILCVDRRTCSRMDGCYSMVREAMAFQHGVQSDRFKPLDLPLPHFTNHRHRFGHLSCLLHFKLSGSEHHERICEVWK